jgi:hypothetical protein
MKVKGSSILESLIALTVISISLFAVVQIMTGESGRFHGRAYMNALFRAEHQMEGQVIETRNGLAHGVPCIYKEHIDDQLQVIHRSRYIPQPCE